MRKTILVVLALILAGLCVCAGADENSQCQTKIIQITGNLNTEMPSYAIGDGDYERADNIDVNKLPVLTGLMKVTNKYANTTGAYDINFGGTKAIFIMNALDYHDNTLTGTRDFFFAAAQAASSFEVALFYGTGVTESARWYKLTGTQNTFDTTTHFVGLSAFHKKVYAMGGNGLKYFDPATRSVQLISNFPSAQTSNYIAPDGTTRTYRDADASDCRYLATWKERAWVAGSELNPSVVYYSGTAFSALNDWNGEVTNDTGEIVVYDGGAIVALYEYKDALLIWTNKSMWEITGSQPSDWYLRQVSKDLGGYNQGAIVEGRKGLYFIGSDEALYNYSNNTITKLSGNFQRSLRYRKMNANISMTGSKEETASNRYPSASGFWNDMVFLSIPLRDAHRLTDISGEMMYVSERNNKWAKAGATYQANAAHSQIGPYGFVHVDPSEICNTSNFSPGLFSIGDYDLQLFMTPDEYATGTSSTVYIHPANWTLYTKAFELSPYRQVRLRRIGMTGEWHVQTGGSTGNVVIGAYANPKPIYSQDISLQTATEGRLIYWHTYGMPTSGLSLGYAANFSEASVVPTSFYTTNTDATTMFLGRLQFQMESSNCSMDQLYLEYYAEPYVREQ